MGSVWVGRENLNSSLPRSAHQTRCRAGRSTLSRGTLPHEGAGSGATEVLVKVCERLDAVVVFSAAVIFSASSAMASRQESRAGEWLDAQLVAGAESPADEHDEPDDGIQEQTKQRWQNNPQHTVFPNAAEADRPCQKGHKTDQE